MHNFAVKVALATALTLVAGCTLMRTSYQRPAISTADVWPHAGAAPVALSPDPWWQRFRDPGLDALIERALAANNQLAAAVIRAQRARLQAGLAGNDLLPQPGASVFSGANRALDQGPTSRSHGALVAASYELDLWGRLSALREAAQWEASATAEDWAALRLSLIATTARLYFQLGYLDDRLEMDALSLDNARRTLGLIEQQYASGATSGLELAEARRTVESQEAARTQVMQQQVETRNALIALLDGDDLMALQPTPPGKIDLPDVDAGLPAMLIARRPDLRALEDRLRAALASVDAVNASFYPTLSLTAQAGASSAALGNLLANPTGALTASLELPFLNVQRVRLTRAVSRAEYSERVATFRQTLRQAFADVDNALSARTQLRLQQERLSAALAHARDAERFSDIRYRTGGIALRDWLAAQEARRSAEAALLENRFNQLNQHVVLSLALGGGSQVGAAPAR